MASSRARVVGALFGEDAADVPRLGRFEIRGSVGAGAMGRVHRAWDPKLERLVAIKLLQTEGLPPEEGASASQRLVREARAIAKLSHRNVVAVHEVGEVETGVFIVMELVEGVDLRAWLAEGRGWKEIVGTFRQAAEGLAAAHAAQLVHRDFKPENVLVAEDGRVVVVDFGLARAPTATASALAATGGEGAVESSGQGTRVDAGSDTSRSQVAAGTPVYMAPEQLRGLAADSLSDQFSFFVALYEALAGRRPHAGRELEERLRNIDDRAFEPLATGPAWLRAAISVGLHPDPQQRHGSMGEVAALLARAERRWPVGRVAVVMAAGLAALGATAWWASPEPAGPICDGAPQRIGAVWNEDARERVTASVSASGPAGPALASRVIERLDAYASRWSAVHTEGCERTHIRGELSPEMLDLRTACLDRSLAALETTVSLVAEGGEKVAGRAQRLALRLPSLDGCARVDALGSQAGTLPPAEIRDAVDDAFGQLAGARMMITAAQTREAEAVADAVLASAAAAHPPVHAEAMFLKGDARSTAEKGAGERELLDAVKEAEAEHLDRLAAESWWKLAVRTRGSPQADERAAGYLERFEAAVARLGNPDDLSASLESLRGRAAQTRGDYDVAARHFESGLALAVDAGLVSREASLRLDLANTQYQQGKYTDAAAAFRELVAMYEQLYGPDHHNTSRAVGNQATALIAAGSSVEAIPLLERSLRSKRASLESDDPRIAISLNSLGSAYYRIGDHARALGIFEEALAINERALGPEDSKLAPPLGNIARCLSKLGRHYEAAKQAQRAVAIQRKALGDDHPELAPELAALGSVRAAGGDYAGAVTAFEESLQIRRARLGPNHVETGYAEHGLAQALRGRGDLGPAAKHATRAIEIFERELGPKHAQLGGALSTLGEIELERGRTQKARESLERALAVYAQADADPEAVAVTEAALGRVPR